jgi:hypothetical protein
MSFWPRFFPDAEEAIYLRAFKPREAPDTIENRARKLTITHEALKQSGDLLEELRRINRHCGLYFVVNAGGQTDHEITRFTAFFCEIDDLPVEEQHRLYFSAPIQPSIRVITRKSVHAYWLISGPCAHDEWLTAQLRLIAYFKSDPAIKNPSRVMRLPFFNHVAVGAGGEMIYRHIELTSFEPEWRNTVEEMLEAFPASAEETKAQTNHQCSNDNGHYTSWEALNAELRRRMLAHPTRKLTPALHHSSPERLSILRPALTDA